MPIWLVRERKPIQMMKPQNQYIIFTIDEQRYAIALSSKDGSTELKIMKEKGAITIAQDKKSSIVHGMPGEAIKLNAANHILSPEEIAVFLNSLDNRR